MRISDWSSDVCSSDLEDGCFAVNPNGRIDSAEALVDALKTSPEELRLGFAVAAGNQWHVAMAVLAEAIGARSEVRRVVKECVSPLRSWWMPYMYNKRQLRTRHCSVNTVDMVAN